MLSYPLWIDPCLFDVDAFNMMTLKDNQNVGLGMQPGIRSETAISCDSEENPSYLNTVLQPGMAAKHGLQRF